MKNKKKQSKTEAYFECMTQLSDLYVKLKNPSAIRRLDVCLGNENIKNEVLILDKMS